MKSESVSPDTIAAYRLAASQWPDPDSDEAIRAGLAAALSKDRVQLFLGLVGVAQGQVPRKSLAQRLTGGKAVAESVRDVFVELAAIEMGDV